MKLTSQETSNENTFKDTKSLDSTSDVTKARTVVLDPELWQDRDVNMYDNWLTSKERGALVSNITESVNFLNKATLSDGQKLVEYLDVENNKKDNKLINLNISIPMDSFRLNGAFDISVLQLALYYISHNLPNKNQNNLEKDINSKTRKKAEQSLIKQDLSTKLVGIDAEELTGQIAQDEFILDKQKQALAPKKLSGLRKTLKHITNIFKLSA